MGEVNKAGISVCNVNDSTNQNASSDLNDRLRNMSERKNDDKRKDEEVMQALVVMQMLSPVTEPLNFQAHRLGISEKKGRVPREGRRLLGPDVGATDAGIGNPAASRTVEKSPAIAMHESRHSAYGSLPRSSVLANSVAGTPASVSSTANSALDRASESRLRLETILRSQTEGQDRKKTQDDLLYTRQEASEKLLRDRVPLQAKSQPTRNATPKPGPAMLPNNVGASEGDNGWVYSFRSWGKQHAVRIHLTPGPVQHSLAVQSTVSLQPFSALVEQRLHDQANLARDSDRWLLSDFGEQQRQQQDARQRQDEGNEDEA